MPKIHDVVKKLPFSLLRYVARFFNEQERIFLENLIFQKVIVQFYNPGKSIPSVGES